jgi:hypothetical protein
MERHMIKRERTAPASTEERDIELDVFEEPLDKIFPRLPNIVSRRGHRALKIVVRVGKEVIPSNATSVVIAAEVITYGLDRIGKNRHVFRHSARWGKNEKPFPLPKKHKPPYTFEIVVEKELGDDHLGEGPYDAFVTVTPMGEGVVSTTAADLVEPRVNIRFVSM